MVDKDEKVTEAARKWAETQHLDINDPRVKKYMRSIGSHNPAQFVDDDDEESSVDYKAGQDYADDNQVDEWLEEDPRFKEAVMHYAESQSLDLNNERVIKYAKGLRSSRGDFGGREQESPIGRRK